MSGAGGTISGGGSAGCAGWLGAGVSGGGGVAKAGLLTRAERGSAFTGCEKGGPTWWDRPLLRSGLADQIGRLAFGSLARSSSTPGIAGWMSWISGSWTSMIPRPRWLWR